MKDVNIQLFIVPEALRAEHQAFGNTSLGGRPGVHCQNGGTSWSQGLSRITVLRSDFRKKNWKCWKHSVFISTTWFSFRLILHAHFHSFPYVFAKGLDYCPASLWADDTRKLSTCCRLHHFSCPFGWLISTTSLRRSSGKCSFHWEAGKWSATTGPTTSSSSTTTEQRPSTNSHNSLWNDVKAKGTQMIWIITTLPGWFDDVHPFRGWHCDFRCATTDGVPWAANESDEHSSAVGHGIFPFGGFSMG